MTLSLTTPATLIARALGITPDPRIRIEVTNTGWDYAKCEETGLPAAVNVEWSTRDYEDGGYAVTDCALAGPIAGDFINTLTGSEHTSPDYTITVQVARLYLRFVHPRLASAANSVDMPTAVAA